MIMFLITTTIGLLIGIIAVWLEPNLKKHKPKVITITLILIFTGMLYYKYEYDDNIKKRKIEEEKINNVAVENEKQSKNNQKKEKENSSFDEEYDIEFIDSGNVFNEINFNNDKSSLIEILCKKQTKNYNEVIKFKDKFTFNYLRVLKNYFNVPNSSDIICIINEENIPTICVCNDGLRFCPFKKKDYYVYFLTWENLKDANLIKYADGGLEIKVEYLAPDILVYFNPKNLTPIELIDLIESLRNSVN